MSSHETPRLDTRREGWMLHDEAAGGRGAAKDKLPLEAERLGHTSSVAQHSLASPNTTGIVKHDAQFEL
jgi:hypothetical protein